MARGRKMSQGKFRGKFRRGTKTHRKNVSPRPMRGGIRL